MATNSGATPTTLPASPSRSDQHEDNAYKNNDSILTRTIFAPILCLSFLFSLLIVDRQSSSSTLSPMTDAPGDAKTVGSGDVKTPTYRYSDQRNLAKQEIARAFAIRGKVIVGMCVFVVLVFVGTVWLGLQAWEYTRG